MPLDPAYVDYVYWFNGMGISWILPAFETHRVGVYLHGCLPLKKRSVLIHVRVGPVLLVPFLAHKNLVLSC